MQEFFAGVGGKLNVIRKVFKPKENIQVHSSRVFSAGSLCLNHASFTKELIRNTLLIASSKRQIV